MKKMIFVVLVLAVVFGFASCDNGTTEGEAVDEEKELSILGKWGGYGNGGSGSYFEMDFVDESTVVVIFEYFGWTGTGEYAFFDYSDTIDREGNAIRLGTLTISNLTYHYEGEIYTIPFVEYRTWFSDSYIAMQFQEGINFHGGRELYRDQVR